MSKDRSKEILSEIKSLRAELDLRLSRIESTAGVERGEGASVRETEVPEFETPAKPSVGAVAPEAPAAPPAAYVVGSSGPSRNVSVVVRPLVDLSLARAVESSLSGSEGIEGARLTSLSGDSAVIDSQVAPGVSVVSALRRSLPVAFDVTDSTDDSVTIELARPSGEEPDVATAAEEIDT